MLEDFADLDIGDETSGPSREDRIRSAFKKSKESYASELVVTEPGWYDPPTIPPPTIPPPTKLHVRNIDYTLHNLYLKRSYSQALALALSQIEVEEKNLISSAQGREGREFQLLDLAIRCALRLGDVEKELAGRLADKTRRKWASNFGLATTSAEAYLAAGRPRDALSAIATVISIRGPQTTLVPILHDALTSLAKEVPEKDLEGLQEIVKMVRDYMEWRRSPSNSNAQAPEAVDELTVRVWLNQCAIAGIDQEKLVALLSRKTSFEKETEGSEVRSVRTL